MTAMFKIVAHRGVTTDAPGNTLAAFRAAITLGVEAVELDVRLARDRVLIVHHNWYLDEDRAAPIPIFERTSSELTREMIDDPRPGLSRRHTIPTLAQVIEELGGKIGLEIELKGPEPESSTALASELARHRAIWDTLEVTSWEAALLTHVRRECPGLRTALLFPASENWMRSDVVAHAALQKARLAAADAVHLHAEQLSDDVVAAIRAGGVEIHAHSVDDDDALAVAVRLQIPWISSDEPHRALAYRERLSDPA